MPDEKADRLITSAELGEKQMKDFVEKRLNTNEVKFWEPLPHLKVIWSASNCCQFMRCAVTRDPKL